MKDLKTANAACAGEGLQGAILNLCKMGEAEAFEAYLENNTFSFPYAKKNAKTGYYEIAVSSKKTIPFEALEQAYWNANERFLTADKYYNTMVSADTPTTVAEEAPAAEEKAA